MIFVACSSRQRVMLIAPEAYMHKCIGSSQENRHNVTIWISLWLLEKMTTDGIRTHTRNNQRHTLVSKSRKSFNAEQALDHSATVAMG